MALSPSRIESARKLRGLTKKGLAAKLQVSSTTVAAWERDGAPDERAGDLAGALRLGPSFFECSEDEVAPVLQPAECNYRSLSRASAADRNRFEGFGYAVEAVIAAVEELAPSALPRIGLDRIDVSSADMPSADPADLTWWAAKLGRRMRQACGLGHDPIPNVVELLESLGVVVVVVPSLVADAIDALSFWRSRPVVVLNYQKKDPYRSRFDALHELGHFVMHRKVTRSRESSGRVRRSPDQGLEREANAFAGAMLVDAQRWARSAPRTTNPRLYLPHRRAWGASAAALMYQAREHGALTPRLYQTMQVRYSQMGWRSGEPVDGALHERPTLLAGAVRQAAAAMGWTADQFADHVGIPATMLRSMTAPEGLSSGNVVSLEARRAPDVAGESGRPVADVVRLLEG